MQAIEQAGLLRQGRTEIEDQSKWVNIRKQLHILKFRFQSAIFYAVDKRLK
jgi:hypothetical protein